MTRIATRIVRTAAALGLAAALAGGTAVAASAADGYAVGGRTGSAALAGQDIQKPGHVTLAGYAIGGKTGGSVEQSRVVLAGYALGG